MAEQQQTASVPMRLIIIGVIGWALWHWELARYGGLWLQVAWYTGALLIVSGSFGLLKDLHAKAWGLLILRAAFGYDDSRGSGRFMTEAEIRKRKLHRRYVGSRFLGIVGKTALNLWTETHHLIIGPAGSWKTSAAIINVLMTCRYSALITDIKGELWETTRAYRTSRFKHKCVKIDPKDPENSVKVNPLDIAVGYLEANDPAVFTFVRGMALQLSPDPEGGGGSNDVFYKGARNLIVTVIFAVIKIFPPEHRNLAMVYRALSDLDILHDLLEAASKSMALNGEPADMARSTHKMAFGDGGNAKTFESFRINALQALEGFGPGNYLAALTSETTFSFADMKSMRISFYILIDFANSDVLAQFSGLLQWMAADALVQAGNNKPVLFCLDEFCNAPLHTLPKILTLLRSAGVRVVMATQDLDDIVRVYSKHALETVLSESHIKQFLGGIRSKSTLEYLSAYLGEYSEISSSYSFGEQTHESISRISRRIMTEDEIRTMSGDAQLIIYGSEKPILAKKVQVFSVEPLRKSLGVNKIYGTKRKLLPVEVRISWFGMKVTAHGRRLYRNMERAVARPDKGKRRFVRSILSRLVPSSGLLAASALVGAVYVMGFPNMLWEYGYRGSARQTPTSYVWCSYIGPTSPGRVSGPDCPVILWRKTW